ncbi:glycosyltransferase family 39 protein [Actinocorallia populi]|uniref:glycosyltransferase family 39 protein n=1 Tax=Actinocorallia populi TaxID=2079200 RepID=UPI000D08DCFC|nr:glycosyltransferase family 39 protein [Actinocorallia populi]
MPVLRHRTPALTVAVPALLTMAITGFRLDGPALWRDEAVTAGMARRDLGSFFAVLGEIDAVHGLYYLLMKAVVALFGDGETALRAPSVLGAVLAAGATAEIGRRLGGARVGLFAGLLVAVSPALSRYAQEARQYTLAAGLAALATLLLVRALRDRRPLRWYGVTIALLGLTHLFTLLLVPAHLAAVLLHRDRALLLRWAPVTAAALAPCAVLAVVALPQSDQVSWIERPDAVVVTDMLDGLAGTPGFFAFTVVLILLGRNGELWRTAAPWMVLPPLLLLVFSLWSPFYVFRYVLFCIPAVALLTAAGLDRLRWSAGVPVLLAAALLALPAHQQMRLPSERADDLRELARIVRTEHRPGDAVVFHYTSSRRVMSAYPEAYAGLDDVLAARPDQGLDGLEVPPRQFAGRLAGVRRIFYVDHSRKPASSEFAAVDARKDSLLRGGRATWIRTGRWLFKGGSVHLYERRPPFT